MLLRYKEPPSLSMGSLCRAVCDPKTVSQGDCRRGNSGEFDYDYDLIFNLAGDIWPCWQ
jgi:hypothetical protein